MQAGDTVTLVDDKSFRGQVVKLPRSEGRKRPRALVKSNLGEEWYPIDRLVKVDDGDS